MVTRILPSLRMREEVATLIEGRLSTASAKDEIVSRDSSCPRRRLSPSRQLLGASHHVHQHPAALDRKAPGRQNPLSHAATARLCGADPECRRFAGGERRIVIETCAQLGSQGAERCVARVQDPRAGSLSGAEPGHCPTYLMITLQSATWKMRSLIGFTRKRDDLARTELRSAIELVEIGDIATIDYLEKKAGYPRTTRCNPKRAYRTFEGLSRCQHHSRHNFAQCTEFVRANDLYHGRSPAKFTKCASPSASRFPPGTSPQMTNRIYYFLVFFKKFIKAEVLMFVSYGSPAGSVGRKGWLFP